MKQLIDAAMGRINVDTLFTNCKVINVFNGEIEEKSIAVYNGKIVGFDADYSANETIDLKGAYVCPGLIDTHMHIESTMMSPAHYAQAVLPYGVTTAVADPHEIGNVLGMKGVEYMIEEGKTVPLDFKFMLPSCVPATPFENNGALIDAAEVEKYINNDDITGLGEFMNYPGVYFGDEDVLAKLEACRKADKIIDGHYPDPTGKRMSAYLIPGIRTDHECIDVETSRLKIANGMYIQMREGSAVHNVKALLPIINEKTLRRCLFCTDDKNSKELLRTGHLDNNVRIAVDGGIDIVDALTIATLNASECYRFDDRGAIAPGRLADFVVFDDPKNFRARQVYKNGKLVAENGKALFEVKVNPPEYIISTMNIKKITPSQLALKVRSNRLKTMRLIPDNLVTECIIKECNVKNGIYQKTDGLSKVAVLERHKGTGNIGIGLLDGYGIENGALAQSVSHDSHNIVVVGDNDEDMALAVNTVIEMGGGLSAVSKGSVACKLELPIAGLMSKENLEYVSNANGILNDLAHDLLHVTREREPFTVASFLALGVIPHLRVTDKGLFDGDKFAFCQIEADEE